LDYNHILCGIVNILIIKYKILSFDQVLDYFTNQVDRLNHNDEQIHKSHTTYNNLGFFTDIDIKIRCHKLFFGNLDIDNRNISKLIFN